MLLALLLAALPTATPAASPWPRAAYVSAGEYPVDPPDALGDLTAVTSRIG